jgi:hypothetical protein
VIVATTATASKITTTGVEYFCQGGDGLAGDGSGLLAEVGAAALTAACGVGLWTGVDADVDVGVAAIMNVLSFLLILFPLRDS